LASGRQYGNALLGVRHQEEELQKAILGHLNIIVSLSYNIS